jgi:protease II
MTNSLLNSYTAHGQDDFIQHTMISRIERVENDVNAFLIHLENSAIRQKIVIKKLLNLRLNQLKTAKKNFKITNTSVTNIDTTEVKTYYCSQLVAEILTTAGVLSPHSGQNWV